MNIGQVQIDNKYEEKQCGVPYASLTLHYVSEFFSELMHKTMRQHSSITRHILADAKESSFALIYKE
jgi:hypothetical protein